MTRTTRILPGFSTLRRTRLVALAGLALLLAACGGGGGGGGAAAPATYPLGGSVSGLPGGATLVLLNNGADAATVSANGSFTFSTPLATGAAYAVTVGTRPSHAHCTIANGSGTVGQAAPSGIAVSCSANPVNLFAYNATLTAATVSAFTVDPSSGALAPVAGSPYAIGNSTSFAVNPAGTLVYSGTPLVGHSIVTFPIDPTTGAVGTTPTTAVLLPAQQVAQSIVFNAAGTMAYAGIVDTTSGFAYSVASYSVNATTGALTPVGGASPSTNASPRITLDPLGTFAFVTSDVTSPNIASAISVFALDPSTHALGAQTAIYPLTGIPTDFINSTAVSPNGSYAYLMDASSATVAGFDIASSTGNLSAIPGYTPYNLPPQPVSMVFNAGGTLAVATAYNSFLAKFTVANDGSLTAVGSVASPLPTGANVRDLAMDPSGSFVYTANSGTGNISGYVVGSAGSGSMADTPGSPYASGSFPSNVAVRAARP